jgi:hypothetical protein
MMTPEQIRAVAVTAGFAGNDLAIAVAIAMAESSDNPDAAGDAQYGGSYGLWQVNLRWHPEYTAEELEDPQTNANAAYAIYKAAGNSFTPWSTFKSGAYVRYLNA